MIMKYYCTVALTLYLVVLASSSAAEIKPTGPARRTTSATVAKTSPGGPPTAGRAMSNASKQRQLSVRKSASTLTAEAAKRKFLDDELNKAAARSAVAADQAANRAAGFLPAYLQTKHGRFEALKRFVDNWYSETELNKELEWERHRGQPGQPSQYGQLRFWPSGNNVRPMTTVEPLIIDCTWTNGDFVASLYDGDYSQPELYVIRGETHEYAYEDDNQLYRIVYAYGRNGYVHPYFIKAELLVLDWDTVVFRDLSSPDEEEPAELRLTIREEKNVYEKNPKSDEDRKMKGVKTENEEKEKMIRRRKLGMKHNRSGAETIYESVGVVTRSKNGSGRYGILNRFVGDWERPAVERGGKPDRLEIWVERGDKLFLRHNDYTDYFWVDDTFWHTPDRKLYAVATIVYENEHTILIRNEGPTDEYKFEVRLTTSVDFKSLREVNGGDGLPQHHIADYTRVPPENYRKDDEYREQLKSLTPPSSGRAASKRNSHGNPSPPPKATRKFSEKGRPNIPPKNMPRQKLSRKH